MPRVRWQRWVLRWPLSVTEWVSLPQAPLADTSTVLEGKASIVEVTNLIDTRLGKMSQVLVP